MVMRVRVLFFGQLREIVGAGYQELEVPASSQVQTVFDVCSARFPGLAQFRPSLAASINEQYSAWDSVVSDGDEVAFLPPVSGGEASEADIFRLVRAPIVTSEIVDGLRSPEDGALVVFDGFVRNNFKGRRTLYLEYEAYESMAYTKMREIAAEIRAKYPVDRIAIVHRLGKVRVGETSVLIAVTAPHRAAAFEACRYAIDTLKRAAPIWKKEFFEGGAVWAEGEMPS